MLARFIFRRLGGEIKDAAAAPSESSALFAEHYGNMLTAACVDVMSSQGRLPSSAPSPAAPAPPKRPSQQVVPAKRARTDPPKPFECVDVPTSTEEAKRILRAAGRRSLGFCRNCYYALRGKINHSLVACANEGNHCLVSCPNPKCNRAVHWRDACPHFAQPSSSSDGKKDQ